MKIIAQDTPIDFEYVGQTLSLNEVELRARVAGFIDKKLYSDGEFFRGCLALPIKTLSDKIKKKVIIKLLKIKKKLFFTAV